MNIILANVLKTPVVIQYRLFRLTLIALAVVFVVLAVGACDNNRSGGTPPLLPAVTTGNILR
jgi:hypothetical protein